MVVLVEYNSQMHSGLVMLSPAIIGATVLNVIMKNNQIIKNLSCPEIINILLGNELLILASSH